MNKSSSKKRKKVTKRKATTKKKSSKKKELNSLWKEYEVILNTWKISFDTCQQAGIDTLTKYNDLCQKALKQDVQLIKRANESWQKVWNEIGPQYIKQQGMIWENMLKASNLDSTSDLNKEWQKYWNIFETK